MNPQTLQRLEYDKIKEKLKGYALSYLGQRHVEKMVPMTDVKELRKKLDEVAEAKALLEHGASVPIPSLEGIERILDLLGKDHVFNVKDLGHIHQFLTSCAQLIKYMAAKANTAPHVTSFATAMSPLAKLKGEIESSIWRGQVLDTASKDLAKVRKRIVVCEERLKSKLASLMGRYRSILQEHVISTRNGRYVIPIKKEYRKQVTGNVLDESASGQTVYVEPSDISQLQFELEALRGEEEREVMKVLMALSALADEYSRELHVNVETVGIYDFLFAKAKYALAIGGSNVQINEQGFMRLREARHPLLGREMVPLHFETGFRYKSLIITGPNTGGKTLTLKTVGLLTLMVQSGLLVPVQEGSLFSIFRHIAVEIGDGQSLEHALSTFSAHIHNVIDILRITDSSTLVLIDEMASGTDPGEGVGLSIAILEELHKRGATIVATTHFNEIKNFAAATPGFENARMEFDTQTLQPLYRLRIGEAGQSYAFSIALKIGLPNEIIERSREVTANGITRTERLDEFTAEVTVTGQAANIVHAEPSQVLLPAWQVAHPEEPQTQKTEERQEAVTEDERQPQSEKILEPGDEVFVSYLGKSGVVYEKEDAKGNIVVLIQNQKVRLQRKHISQNLKE
ncbi:MAG TPA: DNA mismatch repair protein MutS [Brevibacillus sp.]|nr:DNA mismatch repair protein MutS [Brevibacillus sp.]